MTQPVRKAVIPAAGLGTRFLPATKSSPKEMLPVVDKPAIQYVVEEAVQAGLTDILIITGRGKRNVEDHFDRNFELEHTLEAAGKHELLKEVQFASDLADIHYVRQRDPLGLGHAISVARHHVGSEPFAVLLSDDIMVDEGALLQSMLRAFDAHNHSVVGLLEVPPADTALYGCVAPGADHGDGLIELTGIVEKPKPADAPSNLAVIGRYVFTPRIFDMLDNLTPGVNGELQLTDGIAMLMREEPVLGYVCEGGRYDVGDKLDFLRANVELALARPDLGPQFAEQLREIVRRHGLT
jgi:UTP--glucose-1-phosphate uridylyltransferase